MPDINIDQLAEPSENDTNRTDDNVEIIHKDQMIELTKPGCEHNWVIDPTDETDHYFAIHCTECPIGKLLDKTVHKKATYV